MRAHAIFGAYEQKQNNNKKTAIYSSEPPMNFLRRIARVDCNIWTAVYDQIVPQDERHWIAAARWRADWTSAKLKTKFSIAKLCVTTKNFEATMLNVARTNLATVSLCYDGTIETRAQHRRTIFNNKLAKIGDNLALTCNRRAHRQSSEKTFSFVAAATNKKRISKSWHVRCA